MIRERNFRYPSFQGKNRVFIGPEKVFNIRLILFLVNPHGDHPRLPRMRLISAVPLKEFGTSYSYLTLTRFRLFHHSVLLHFHQICQR